MALMLGRGISREYHPEPLQDASFDADPDSPTSQRSNEGLDENDQSYLNETHSAYNGYPDPAQEPRKSSPIDRSYSTPQRSLAQQSEDYDQVLWASAPHQVAVVNTGHVLSAQRYLNEIESVIEEKRNQLLKLRRSNEQRKLSMLSATGKYPTEAGGRTNLGSHFSTATAPTTPARSMLRELDEITSTTKRTPGGKERTPGAGVGEGAHGYLLYSLHESQLNEVESVKKITELKKMKDQRESDLRQAQSEIQQLLAELRLRDERVQSLEELMAEIRRGGDPGPHFHEYHAEIINGGDNTANEEIKKMLADIQAQLQRTSQDRDKLMDDVMALQEELALERVRPKAAPAVSAWRSVWTVVIIWCFIMLALYSHAVDFMPNTIDRYRITS